ncbi:hypothetical protein SKAU_G00228230 [Synaphobranchus kaupii]|uniref:Uncharacterized protein n=1 Tax=Synaphobranchus kaupii TaxID=118154 RepID=A0A9Q1F526_SYNKA|nr:hypothetical protein SKAU_G00228230 [Synaphobranchus kaupii]
MFFEIRGLGEELVVHCLVAGITVLHLEFELLFPSDHKLWSLTPRLMSTATRARMCTAWPASCGRYTGATPVHPGAHSPGNQLTGTDGDAFELLCGWERGPRQHHKHGAEESPDRDGVKGHTGITDATFHQ